MDTTGYSPRLARMNWDRIEDNCACRKVRPTAKPKAQPIIGKGGWQYSKKNRYWVRDTPTGVEAISPEQYDARYPA